MVWPFPCGFLATADYSVSGNSGSWVKSIATAYTSPWVSSRAGARSFRNASSSSAGGNAYMVTAHGY